MPTSPEGSITVSHMWKRFRADPGEALFTDEIRRLTRRLKGERTQWRWALRDVNLDIAPGDAVALIGVNGSGKSTLLKILSKVMFPNAGRLDVSGRIGALIEVRAGIHPDLTGRENVFFYGTVLGLSRRQVAERFDDIVEFAGLSDAVSRQVKYYSSGMQMRLGFAIAAFLEPDVLMVDEVLAVGDTTFQQRCLERMRLVLARGTTLVFVSHDLAAVEAMCDRAVWLDDSVVRADGPVREVLARYRQAIEQQAVMSERAGSVVSVRSATVTGPDGGQPLSSQRMHVRLVLDSARRIPGRLSLGISEGTAMPIFAVSHDAYFPCGRSEVRCELEQVPLPAGRYYLWAAMFGLDDEPPMEWHPVVEFDVFGPAPVHLAQGIMVLSPVHVAATWDVA